MLHGLSVLSMKECSYRNDTPSMVVLKCIGIDHFHLERVVMPTETYLFSAPEDARVELWRLAQGGQICQERADVQEFWVSKPDAMNLEPPRERESSCVSR